jgi:hypothetical protein
MSLENMPFPYMGLFHPLVENLISLCLLTTKKSQSLKTHMIHGCKVIVDELFQTNNHLIIDMAIFI